MDAILIGAMGALASYFCLRLLEKRRLDDTLDVFACHGVAGIVGSILTGVFANASVNPAGSNGLLYGNAGLLQPQIEATLVAILFSAFMTASILKILEKTIGLRTHTNQEIDIDKNLHDETAYGGYQHIPLGELVVKSKLATHTQIHQCLEIQKKTETHKPLGEILVRKKLIKPEELQQLLVQQKLAA